MYNNGKKKKEKKKKKGTKTPNSGFLVAYAKTLNIRNRKKSRNLVAVLLFYKIRQAFKEPPAAQWLKRWPTDLAGPSSIRTRGEIFSTVNGVPLHTAFYYHPNIVLIYLNYC